MPSRVLITLQAVYGSPAVPSWKMYKYSNFKC
jgi:hypothetical protein